MLLDRYIVDITKYFFSLKTVIVNVDRYRLNYISFLDFEKLSQMRSTSSVFVFFVSISYYNVGHVYHHTSRYRSISPSTLG